MELNKYYYLLGFCLGDGSVDKAGRIYIRLAYKDSEFLNKLSSIFGGPVQEYMARCQTGLFKSVRWQVPKEASKRLISSGLVTNKTYKTNSNVFNRVPEEFKPDFIRGYFDADGSIGEYSSGWGSSVKYTFSIVSKDRSVLDCLQCWFESKLGHKINIITDSDYYRLRQSGNIKCQQIYKQIYYKNCLCLDRKRLIFEDCQPKLIKGYHFHRASKKWRISAKPFVGLTFNSELECQDFIRRNYEKFTSKMATT